MNGTAHAAIGSATGFIVANTFHTSPSTTILFVGLGCVSGLIPDLDIDGKLRGKITLSHQVIRSVSQLIGLLMMIYSFYEDNWLSMGIGFGLMILSSFLKQKHMLIITGIAVITAGYFLQEIWLSLLGTYIIIASLVPHRSYTHSLLGVIFFGYISLELENSLAINGVFYTCIAGYISHLIADLKLLPVNKRGIKLFLPFSSKDI
ncbi:metal-dependent hydrolase [Bacillus sp. PS06]|uniref:metal-dependent hydrolase n=1 Tax=Bacillus sp. PS06 TaxID=2764176 RepID=UPI0017867B2C|nr:metal-dependent hydrolase [Bacillus sp. PS06]MBD8068168.1 metal-dependent hydrolase [Bacillus sp. PS06]